MKEWKFSIIVVFFEVLKRAVVRTPDLQRILQQMPTKICKNMPIFAKIRVVNLLNNPL